MFDSDMILQEVAEDLQSLVVALTNERVKTVMNVILSSSVEVDYESICQNAKEIVMSEILEQLREKLEKGI